MAVLIQGDGLLPMLTNQPAGKQFCTECGWQEERQFPNGAFSTICAPCARIKHKIKQGRDKCEQCGKYRRASSYTISKKKPGSRPGKRGTPPGWLGILCDFCVNTNLSKQRQERKNAAKDTKEQAKRRTLSKQKFKLYTNPRHDPHHMEYDPVAAKRRESWARMRQYTIAASA